MYMHIYVCVCVYIMCNIKSCLNQERGKGAQAIDHKTSGGRIAEQTGKGSIWKWTKYNVLNEPRNLGPWFIWYVSFFLKIVTSMSFQYYIGNYYHAYIWATIFTSGLVVHYRMAVSQTIQCRFLLFPFKRFPEQMGITKRNCWFELLELLFVTHFMAGTHCFR